LTSEQLSVLPLNFDVDNLFVTNSGNRAGEIMFGVTRQSTEEGDLTIFTALQ